MKRKIKILDKTTGKNIEHEATVRNLEHFNIQLHTKAQVYTPKKGKGSYSRKQKHKENN